jgi:hypothetical protein
MHHNQRIGADKEKRGKDVALKIEAALILLLQLCALLALFF